jgi:PUA-domain protein
VREKEAKKLLSELRERVKGIEQHWVSMESHVEVAIAEDVEIFFVKGEPVFAKSGGIVFPTLASPRLLSSMPKAVVNMGAIPYVCNGADVMAPGVVRYEGAFDKASLVVVVDERHTRPISIALALCSSEEAGKLERGKVLENLHYIGDAIWDTIKHLSQTN